MQTYRKPKIKVIETDSYFLKAQATPQITCDPGTGCPGDTYGAFCDNGSAAGAVFFLPGSDGVTVPSCQLFVNGIQAASCEIETIGDDACGEGAQWFINCDANVTCTGNDTLVVSCDGFQDSEPCAGFPL